MDESQRVVPVTRRRLRQRGGSVGWPALVEPVQSDLSAAERCRILDDVIADEHAPGRAIVLVRAVREEEGALRLAALKALVTLRCADGLETFREVLSSGSDAERSLAIDGLAALGATEDLALALSDRLEPLAAKAALHMCPSRKRQELDALLQTNCDALRRDAILGLLAGYFDA